MAKANAAREKMQRYRERLRSAGLRPVQVWVPDTSAPGFAEEARRQSLLVSRSPSEEEALDFIEAAADTDGWK
ncbi:MAG TPA: antitoxin MazE family protein [Syntrophobacteraceae bacterium]|nr:antitoxin MazE family protein [Syntrophobacteraceae bacterium]